MGVKLRRIEGLSRKKDEETSKKQTTGTSRRGKNATIGIVNSGHPASQPISVDYTPALPTSQAYAHPVQQLLAGNKIRTEAPGPHFDPSMQNQNLRCEFHQGAPGHTLDTCWRLQDKIQEMIDTRQISFNEAKPPNVRANLLPDHGSGSGPSINMISIAAIEEEEDSHKASIPFVINYAPAEVAFAHVSFVIEIPAKEPYHDSRVPWTYEGEVPVPVDKGKAPATAFSTVPEAVSLPTKKVTDQEAETLMKVIKSSEYKVVEQMGKSPAHISLLALLLNFEPHRNALLKVLIAAQVPKKNTPERIEEIILEIPNAFSLLLGRPWIHVAGAVPSSLHQKLKFFIEGKLITVNGEKDYAVYKETTVPYISIGEDQNLPFHSFDTISIIRDYGEVGPSQTDRMIGRKLFRGIPIPPLSQFFFAPPQIMGGTSDTPITETDDFSSNAVEAFLALPAIYAVTEEISSRVHICPAWEDEELTNWTSVPLYSAIVVDV
ncbi:hypothetical protein CRG98_032279 [Punica granatum]|uniref:Uncharacterized protein n=1 Tax=Punica granatum TaxID=22663 RepID=A0A2I0ITI3_PUNGR|nr:hypothetical protein CRG98_032279 [Punica granatum]